MRHAPPNRRARGGGDNRNNKTAEKGKEKEKKTCHVGYLCPSLLAGLVSYPFLPCTYREEIKIQTRLSYI